MFGSSWLVRGLVRGLLWTWAALFQLANWDMFLTFSACLESWLIDITLCYPAVQSQSCDHILNRRRPNLERVFSWVAHRTSSSSTVQLEKPIEWEIEKSLGKKKEKRKVSCLFMTPRGCMWTWRPVSSSPSFPSNSLLMQKFLIHPLCVMEISESLHVNPPLRCRWVEIAFGRCTK